MNSVISLWNFSAISKKDMASIVTGNGKNIKNTFCSASQNSYIDLCFYTSVAKFAITGSIIEIEGE